MNRVVLSASAWLLLFLSGTAAAAVYNCLPVELLEQPTSVQVLCAEPSGWEGGYPKDGNEQIKTFALPRSDVDFSKRFLHVAQTALTAGMIVQFQYTSGDHSGSVYGCAPSSCRKPWAFGLLAPATDVRIPYAVWPSGAIKSLAQGNWEYYGPFSISSFRKLMINMTGTGNADLYVRKNDPPTETAFTCRPLLGSSNESCNIPGPDPSIERAATYFVGVRGSGAINQYSLNVSIKSK